MRQSRPPVRRPRPHPLSSRPTRCSVQRAGWSPARSAPATPAVPGKLTTVLPLVRPDNSHSRRRLVSRRPAPRLCRSNRPLEEVRLDRPLQRLQRHDAPRLLRLRHIVRHPLRRQRVRPLRILEGEHAVIADRLGQRQRLLEVGFRFSPGKPTIISVDSCTFGIASRIRATRSRYSSRVWRRRIRPSTRVEPDCTGRCRCLQTFGRIAHRRDQAIARVARMRAGKADALDAGDVVDRFEQRREIAGGIVGRLVVIHDLSEQLHLAAAARRGFARRQPESRPSAACARGRACTAPRRTRRSRCSLR